MSLSCFRAILPAVALALSAGGVVSATTINIDNRPVAIASAVKSSPSQRLMVAMDQDNSSTESFSLTIAGDYIAFESGSQLFPAGGFEDDGPIMLSFEVTSGYAPEAGILRAIRALIGR